MSGDPGKTSSKTHSKTSGEIDLAEPVTEHDHAIGPSEARVTLVEYGDYECPDCFNAVPIVQALVERLGPKLRVVYRHFPLNSIHPHASAAARAAEAANLQDRFWAMHAALFKNQKHLTDVDLTHLALNLGLEVYRFHSDIVSDAVTRRVRADAASGQRSGVTGTPTFFINGHRYRGENQLESLLKAIELH